MGRSEKFLTDTEFNVNQLISKIKNSSENLNDEEKKILEEIISDFKNNDFSLLTPQEINWMEKNKSILWPKYLVYRYNFKNLPKKKELASVPLHLLIEPVSACNLRCVMCFQIDETFSNNQEYMGMMDLNLFKKIIDDAEGKVEFISLASRGEPFACKDIEKMLNYTNGKFLNLKINTNASLVDEEMSYAILESGVKTLVFSADAADSALYSKLRVNGKLEKIVTNIKKFQEIRTKNYPNSKIITRVAGVKVNNQQNLDDMEKYWSDFVDQVAFVNYVPWENVYQSKYSGIQTPCSDLWRRMFVWWDGKVNPCDVDYKSKLLVGDIKNNNILKLWKSDAYNKLRQQHESKLRKNASPCNRCVVI